MGDQNQVATFMPTTASSFQVEPVKSSTNGTVTNTVVENHSHDPGAVVTTIVTPPSTEVSTAATPVVVTIAPSIPLSVPVFVPAEVASLKSTPNSVSTVTANTAGSAVTNSIDSTIASVVNNNAKAKSNSGTSSKSGPAAAVTPAGISSASSKKKKKKQQQPEESEDDGIKKRRKTWAPEDQKYACDKCNFRSAYASSLGRHKASSHKSDTSSTKDVNESSCGSTSSSTPAPAVTPTPAPTPPTPSPAPVATTILTIPKVEVPVQVHVVQPGNMDESYRHQQPQQSHHTAIAYEYHAPSSSTFQDVVNTPPVYNTSVRFDTNDGIPITLMEPTSYNSMSHNESEYLPFQKTEEEMATIRAEPTVLTTLSTMAVPVNDIISLPPQSATLTPLTSAPSESTPTPMASSSEGVARKRPAESNPKPNNTSGGSANKKRKKEEAAPTFTALSGPSVGRNDGNNGAAVSATPPKKKKKKTANIQGGDTANAVKNSSSTLSNPNLVSVNDKDKSGDTNDETEGGKKKRQKRKPSDKPSNPCMITSTSSACPVCNFTTKYQFNLARHFQATHKAELQSILDGTKTYPGIRKREIKEKTPKTKPKSEKKPKRPANSGVTDQGNQSSGYTASQNQRTLSVAQEFEQFVRDENLEMFAEADNLDFSEPMVSSFIESLFSTDMGNEGWSNVNSHGVVLNPSVHPQTIATTATYIHGPPQTVGQSSYVTTVDLLPTHQTQGGQVVGNFIQPQQLYTEFQKPHTNPIQANVVINGVTTTMDLNVIEKNARHLHTQPETSPHQTQSKVFIAQSLESHSGVGLELNCPPQYHVQQSNGFPTQPPNSRPGIPAHQQPQQKWISVPQSPGTISTASTVGNSNVDLQWGGNVFHVQAPSSYPNTANLTPSQPQYQNTEIVTEVRAIDMGGVDNNTYLYSPWPSQQQPASTIQQIQIPVTQHAPGFPSLLHQQQIKPEVSEQITTVDTSFLQAAIADKSHLSNETSSAASNPSAPLNDSLSVNTPAPLVKSKKTKPSRSKQQNKDEKETVHKMKLANRREQYKMQAEKKKQHSGDPVVEAPPAPTSTKQKNKVDINSLAPEEQEKRQRYLQRRRERWKAAQEKKKLLKQESDSLSGQPSSNSASVSGSDSNVSPAAIATPTPAFIEASSSEAVTQQYDSSLSFFTSPKSLGDLTNSDMSKYESQPTNLSFSQSSIQPLSSSPPVQPHKSNAPQECDQNFVQVTCHFGMDTAETRSAPMMENQLSEIQYGRTELDFLPQQQGISKESQQNATSQQELKGIRIIAEEACQKSAPAIVKNKTNRGKRKQPVPTALNYSTAAESWKARRKPTGKSQLTVATNTQKPEKKREKSGEQSAATGCNTSCIGVSAGKETAKIPVAEAIKPLKKQGAIKKLFPNLPMDERQKLLRQRATEAQREKRRLQRLEKQQKLQGGHVSPTQGTAPKSRKMKHPVEEAREITTGENLESFTSAAKYLKAYNTVDDIIRRVSSDCQDLMTLTGSTSCPVVPHSISSKPSEFKPKSTKSKASRLRKQNPTKDNHMKASCLLDNGKGDADFKGSCAVSGVSKRKSKGTRVAISGGEGALKLPKSKRNSGRKCEAISVTSEVNKKGCNSDRTSSGGRLNRKVSSNQKSKKLDSTEPGQLVPTTRLPEGVIDIHLPSQNIKCSANIKKTTSAADKSKRSKMMKQHKLDGTKIDKTKRSPAVKKTDSSKGKRPKKRIAPTEAELKNSVKLGSESTNIQCSVQGCGFVATTNYCMTFHQSCHKSLNGLSPFLKSLVSLSDPSKQIFNLRPTPGSLLDSSQNESSSSSDSDLGSLLDNFHEVKDNEEVDETPSTKSSFTTNSGAHSAVPTLV